MARDLGELLRPLSASPEPGLDAADPRLAALAELASRSRYDVAADRIEDLFAAGIYDIRALSFYLFQAFQEGGFLALEQILDVALAALGENLPAIGPIKRQREHFDRRLGWLFGEIADAVDYHERERTRTWEAWSEGAGVAEMEEIVRRAERVEEALRAGAYETAAGRLARLLGLLRRRVEALSAPPPAPAPAPAAAAESALPGAAAPQTQAASAAPSLPDAPVRIRVELSASHHFIELRRKIVAFEALVEKRDFTRAAVLADELQRLIEQFDPLAYFPDLFAGFNALLSEHIAPIAASWEDRESPAWKALAQLCRVDLEGFVSGRGRGR